MAARALQQALDAATSGERLFQLNKAIFLLAPVGAERFVNGAQWRACAEDALSALREGDERDALLLTALAFSELSSEIEAVEAGCLPAEEPRARRAT